jgi:predicted glutamine amidotransferase
MCILIQHNKTSSFSDELLTDFYTHNSDGFGLMYGDGNKLHITKSLGSVEETIALYRDLAEGRDCVIHYRMKTHGKIDLTNCHPYRITDELWVAHNGILSASNPINKDLSDTWHLIEYILKPIAEQNADKFFEDDFIRYMESLIGSTNKLAFCHADGRTSIVNRDSGVEYQESWMSNTYAWSAAKFGVRSNIPTYTKYSNYSSKYDWMYEGYDYDEVPPLLKSSAPAEPKDYVGNITEKAYFSAKKVAKAAYNSWMRGERHLIQWVIDAPEKATFFLEEYYQFEKGEIYDMVLAEPEEAASWVADLFMTDSVQPSLIQ